MEKIKIDKDLTSDGYILRTDLFKNCLKFNFSFEISSQFLKYLSNLSSFCIFCQNSRKIHAGLLQSFEKYAKITRFAIFLRNPLQLLRKRSAHPIPGRPPKAFLPTEILAAPLYLAI